LKGEKGGGRGKKSGFDAREFDKWVAHTHTHTHIYIAASKAVKQLVKQLVKKEGRKYR
jgi:hypothetical protein